MLGEGRAQNIDMSLQPGADRCSHSAGDLRPQAALVFKKLWQLSPSMLMCCASVPFCHVIFHLCCIILSFLTLQALMEDGFFNHTATEERGFYKRMCYLAYSHEAPTMDS